MCVEQRGGQKDWWRVGADDVIAVRWAGLGLGLVWRTGSGRLGEKMESRRVGFCLGDLRPWL